MDKSLSSDPSVYEDEPYCLGVGENLFNLETGEVTRHLPEERKASQKDARRIAALPDSAITEYPPRRSGIVDYRIENCSVSWRGLGHGKKREFLCHGHVVNVCVHTKRIKRYREEHPVESAA